MYMCECEKSCLLVRFYKYVSPQYIISPKYCGVLLVRERETKSFCM